MEKVKLIGLIIAGLVGVYFVAKAIVESPFEKLERNAIDIPDNWYDDPSQKGASEAYQNSDINFRELYPTENNFMVEYYDEEYWVFWTGVQTFEDGFKVFIIPNYSRLIVVDRNTNEILSNKLFFKETTNVKVIDGYVYFVYQSFLKTKLGRYKLPS